MRAAHRAESDSAVAARLAGAGAILVGKTHTHEFAYGLITPQTVSARDGGRIAGGASGGFAVAVAAGMATLSLGADTGGSIRVPAALNGVVGLKPSYDLVPREGVVPLSWSLDHVGPITRTAEDAALVMGVLCGVSTVEPSGLRVGVPGNYDFDHVDPEVESAVRSGIGRLEALGVRLVDVEIPMTRFVQGVQWGLTVPEASAYHEPTVQAVSELYAADVRVLLEAGRRMSAVDYLRAQRARTLMRREWSRLMEMVDVIAAPAVPVTAVPVGQEGVTWPDGTTESVGGAYVRLSAPANITGLPSLIVPVGEDRAGLPTGVQLIGRAGGDGVVLGLGRAFES